MSEPIQVLCQGGSPPDLATSSYGPFVVQGCRSLADVAEQIQLNRYDVLLLLADGAAELDALLHWNALPNAVLDSALVVLTPEPAAADVVRLLQAGVQEVLPSRDAGADRLALALRQGSVRKRLELAAKRAYATDLSTGLPNHAQLMEHMTHVLALREREPAPMALLALRVEGLAAAQARLGSEAANVLRRKIAVRLRSGLRASDVVAALGDDRFAVLLAWLDDAADGDRVVAKLTQSLQRPLSVAGQDVSVSVAAGVARYPGDGRDAETLLRLAVSQASQLEPQSRSGLFSRRDRADPAANDELPSRL